jgi:hypothetical protein
MPDRVIKILLQTTIPYAVDDWSIARFGRLAEFLRGERTPDGLPAFEVTARDRDPIAKPDSVLACLDESDFDEMWLFAVDVGNGLTPDDCEGITRFRQSGRGLLITRDHMDLGSSVCTLGGVGKAHYFHSRNSDPDAANHRVDDPFSKSISWPNFHSGANGDFQKINPVGPVHPVLADPSSAIGSIEFLPSHPHEGAVDAPAGEQARIIATGTSKITGRRFNIAVAFEPGTKGGPAIAQSTFHHFVDYNWDPSSGCPSFVEEQANDGIVRTPKALADTQLYVRNLAYWLANRTSD